MKNKKFATLFWTQFYGALNDNVFKNAMVILMTYKEATLFGLPTASVVALAGGVFILPFFLFSAWAGQLADRYQRIQIARYVKWAELFIMIVCSFGFLFHHFELLMLGLFGMGVHSTFFGPVKYSLIPDYVESAQVTTANAYVEAGTFVAILFGTILGGVTAAEKGQEWLIVLCLLLISLFGLYTSYKLAPTAVAHPELKIRWNPFTQTWAILKIVLDQRALFWRIIGVSWFWFLGAAVLSILPVYTKNFLFGAESVVTFFLTVFVVGIACGSAASSYYSKNGVRLGLSVIGAIGMTLGLLDWAWASALRENAFRPSDLLHLSEFLSQPSSWRITFDLFFVAFFGGLFTVPQATYLQVFAPRQSLSRVIAANNILNALFMVLSAVMMMGFYALKLKWSEIFLIIGFVNLFSILVLRKK